MRFIIGIDVNGNHFYSETDVSKKEFRLSDAEFLERFGLPVLAHLRSQVEKNVKED